MFDDLNNLTSILPIVIVGFTILILALVFIPLMRGSAQRRRLLQEGESAPATILQVWETGTRINEQPQIGLLLDVRPSTRPAFQVKTTMLISFLQASMFQPGMQVEVRFDPNDLSQVTISGVTGAPAMGMGGGMMMGAGQAGMMGGNAQQLQAMMVQIDAENKALLARGESAQASVLRIDPMGFTVNGENPAVSVTVEVRPANRAPFQAVTRGVIASTSMHKYQPGSTIWVKFDPNDTSKVTIERSA